MAVTGAVPTMIAPGSSRIPDDRRVVFGHGELTAAMRASLRDERVPVALLVPASRGLPTWRLRRRPISRAHRVRSHATTCSSMLGMVSADAWGDSRRSARTMQNLSIGAAITVVKTAIRTTIA